MSTFEVRVYPVEIHPHGNADSLEIAQIQGYKSIVGKGQYRDGDLVAYIPEDAVVPEDVLREMNLHGKLAGSAKNRVKAIRLRGVISQGICYPAKPEWEEGQVVTEQLGITKYEPPIPTNLGGAVWNAGGRRCLRYRIENLQKYPKQLVPGEQVVITEKIHGTFVQFGIMPEELEHKTYGRLVVASKGLGSQGLAFIPTTEGAGHFPGAVKQEKNLYLRAADALLIYPRAMAYKPLATYVAGGNPVHIMGEIFGQGVQDLHYGANVGIRSKLGFRVFDIHLGGPNGRYLNDDELDIWVAGLKLSRVPMLFRGPYDPAWTRGIAQGKETISGNQMHIREGVIVRPTVERYNDKVGRVQFKIKSDAYLLRKGGTEHS